MLFPIQKDQKAASRIQTSSVKISQGTSCPPVRCLPRRSDHHGQHQLFSAASARFISNLPVALINDSDIQICRNYYPSSLELPEPSDGPRITKISKKNKKRLTVAPSQVMDIFLSLHRAKAAGNERNSLDIVVKPASSYARSKIKKFATFSDLKF